jgi:hypothetical protein
MAFKASGPKDAPSISCLTLAVAVLPAAYMVECPNRLPAFRQVAYHHHPVNQDGPQIAQLSTLQSSIHAGARRCRASWGTAAAPRRLADRAELREVAITASQ